MINIRLTSLVYEFRGAIESAKSNGDLDNFKFYRNFPRACCGETSSLLAKYLYQYGFKTIYVCGDCNGQSHAWLILKDKTINEIPIDKTFYSDEIVDVLKEYGSNVQDENIVDYNFEISDIEKGLIIDITADQFIEMDGFPVYIGYANEFYKKFNIQLYINHPWEKVDDNLYELINSYIEIEDENL